MVQLKKEIKLNFIGSERFYNYNQLFFMMTLFFKLFESVTFNSLSCVPGLMLIIILFAAYELRKTYSQFFRTFSFVTVYWIRLMMIIKISAEIYAYTPNINVMLNSKKNDDEHW